MKNQKQDLAGVWDFTFLPGNATGTAVTEAKFDSRAVVPGCFDLMPGLYLRRGTGIYRRTVEAGGEVELTSDGIGLRAEIFWDQRKIAEIDAPFSKNIIRFDAGACGEHELIIAVCNEFDDSFGSLFRRNYDFYAHGGIFRGLTLAPARKIQADELKVIPLDLERGTVRISVRFSGAALPGQAEVFFDQQTAPAVLPLENGAGSAEFTVPEAKIWSPETPFLHRVRIAAGGEEFSTRFGLRKIEVRDARLYLNGQPLKLVGCNRHDSHPEFGYAVPAGIRLRDLQLLKQNGMNCIRGCHYPQSEEFLDLCDELGVLVWEESLGWGNSVDCLKDPDFQAKQVRETRKMALKSINHPSVILWGFLNELDSTSPDARPLVKALADTLRETDPSRPVTFASNRLQKDVCLDLVDVISFNTYPGWYSANEDQFINREFIVRHLQELADFVSKPEYAAKPMLISEIGSEAAPGLTGGYRWTEEYQADLLETVVRFVLDSDRCSGTFLWQFCDSRTFISSHSQLRPGGFNSKGMLDRYRTPKQSWHRIGQVLREYSKR